MTVVALEEIPEQQWKLREQDIREMFTKDSGPGGQHRNKTESCVVLRHIPTGIEAKSSEKSQHANRKAARAVLEARVRDHFQTIERDRISGLKKEKAGSGMRGDKIRTYREQDDVVSDHRTGKKARLKDVRRGDLSKVVQFVPCTS